MSDRNIGQEIFQGIKEIKRFRKGEIDLTVRTLNEPSPTKTIRKRLRLSQSAFASLMGVSPRTIQDWEQGRRKPQGPAKSLLRIAEQHPEIFIEIR
jgi:putative transcriptional regulator